MANPEWARVQDVCLSGGKIGLRGDAAYIDPVEVASRFKVDYLETTDADDSAPTFGATGYIYGTLAVKGWLVQGQKAGFVSGSFKDGTTLAVTATLANGRSVAGTILLVQSDVRWRDPHVDAKGNEFVPLSFFALFTGSITEA